MPKLAALLAALLTFIPGGPTVTVPTDFPDFTQPVAFQEQVSADLLVGAGLRSDGSGHDVSLSGYQSVGIRIDPSPSAAGTRYMLEAAWISGNDLFDLETVSFHSQPSGPHYPSSLFWQLPVRGPILQLQLIGSDNVVVPVKVFGSTRPVNSEHLDNTGDFDGSLILDTGSINVAAGATSAVFYIPPVARAINIKMNGVGTEAMHFNLDGVNGLNQVTQVNNLDRRDGTAPNLSVNNLVIPRTGLQVTMSNDGAAAHNLRVLVWDAS